MPAEAKEINKTSTAFFLYKKLNGKYLITNELREYCFLDSQGFDAFLSGRIVKNSPDKYAELKSKGFIRNQLDFAALSRKYASRNSFLFKGTSLHIIVVTLRCDHSCIYCQAGSRHLKAKELDMDIPTAEKVVDRIFDSPGRQITIEFQGGEPLVNSDIVKFIIKYSLEKNKLANKKLAFTLVSNLSFMNDEILSYLIKNNVQVCSSLDGHEKIHNKHRIISGQKNSYKNTTKWLKKINSAYKKFKVQYRPGALTTVTKYSLSYHKEIIDEYVKLGLYGIHLRPVTPFGASYQLWKKISFSAEEFINFYTKGLDYVVDLNLKGKKIYERTAQIFLKKILSNSDPDYLDIRSPCGAAIGQLAYNFNGDIYSCDEGRMLARRGDDSFKLGNAKNNSYSEIMDSSVVKTMCIASCLECLPGCSQCAYKPYCGVCPIYNYVSSKNIFIKSSFLCKIHMGILDYLFVKLQDNKIKEIFLKWL